MLCEMFVSILINLSFLITGTSRFKPHCKPFEASVGFEAEMTCCSSSSSFQEDLLRNLSKDREVGRKRSGGKKLKINKMKKKGQRILLGKKVGPRGLKT